MKINLNKLSKNRIFSFIILMLSFQVIYIADRFYSQLSYILLIDCYFFFFIIGLSSFFYIAVLELVNAKWSAELHYIIVKSFKILPLSIYFLFWLFIEIIFEKGKIGMLVPHQSVYFNPEAIQIRTLFLYILWSFIIIKLNLKKVNNDSVKYFKYPALYIILYLFTLTIISIDFFNIFHPEWFNPIIGIYIFSSSFPASLSLIILIYLIISRQSETIANNYNILRNLGKLIFGFSIFWVYITISQILIIKYANMPDEMMIINQIFGNNWIFITFAVFILKFFIPFFLLLNKNSKSKSIILLISSLCILFGTFTEILLISIPRYFEPIVIIYPILFILLSSVYFGSVIYITWKNKNQLLKKIIIE
jgi:hypothetical protein